MAKARVRSDNHGLLIRAKGHVFRPQVSSSHRHLKRHHPATKAQDGMEVDIVANAASDIAHVSVEGVCGVERWFAHGQYLTDPPKMGFLDTNELWNPA